MNVRAHLGLDSDLAYVRSLESDPSLNTSEIGYPVSALELSALEARDKLGESVNRISSVLADVPTFGGVWFVQQGTGIIDVGLTGQPTPAITQLIETVDPTLQGDC